MVDYIKIMVRNLTASEIDAVCHGQAFTVARDRVQDKDRGEKINYWGMTMILNPIKRTLEVKGALPTFANGNNLHLLTYSEMVSTCINLATATGLPGSRLTLVNLELSNDIDPTTSPQSFFESLQHHKGSKFIATKPGKGVTRPLEYCALHADYTVKIYDKGEWTKHDDNHLPTGQHRMRFEVVYGRARSINILWNRSETTLADLISLEFYAAAAVQLKQQWEKVVRQQPLDFTGLKKSDQLLLGAGANPEYWRELKTRCAHITYKRTRKKYGELVKASAERVGRTHIPNGFHLLSLRCYLRR